MNPGGGEAEGRRAESRQRPAVSADWGQLEAELLGFEFLESKLRPARPRLQLVPRDGLLDRLQKTTASLVLISASAGAGKSTMLMQWADSDPRPTAWLGLDGADNDQATFLRYLALALGQVAAVGPPVFDLLRHRSPPVLERVLPRFATALADVPPFLLVLDDGHMVRNRHCWQAVSALLDQLPAGAQLAIGTREDPPLPLARMRVGGRLAEFRTEELALAETEAVALLRLHGVTMDAGDLEAALAATEGWVTGIYLASLVAETLPPGEWLPHVRGDQVEIARYLTDEVLGRLSPHLRSFLVRTSILERLCAGVCTAVTGRGDAGVLLARAARKNLFVTALDDHGECYRYHHLFAENLRADLERREPDEVPRLHRAAAAWFDGHDDAEAAVTHWLAAGDLATATHAAALACGAQHFVGAFPKAARLLRRFSADQIMSDRDLTLEAGWTLGLVCGDRREQRRWGPLACGVEVDDRPSPAGAASARSYRALLRACLGPDGVTQMCKDAELAARLESDQESEWALVAASVLGWALYLAGRADRAAQLLNIAAEGDWSLKENRVDALALLSLAAGDAHRWDDAEEYDCLAVELVPALGSEENVGYLALLAPLLAHARILSRRRDPGLVAYLGAVGDYVGRMVPQSDCLRLLASVVLGEVWLEQGDLAVAGIWSDMAVNVLERYPDAGMLGARTKRLARALEARRLGEPLTPAERDLLGLLATHLTPQQIAECLFVSRNTVKSHRLALYRKLGVTSRGDAVFRAREIGLL